MKRGDFVTIALQGDYGKPRPALIVQSDDLSPLSSVLVCPITSDLREARDFRVIVEPSGNTGLRAVSQIMVDKLSVAGRDRIGAVIGEASPETMTAVTRALLMVLGITRPPS